MFTNIKRFGLLFALGLMVTACGGGGGGAGTAVNTVDIPENGAPKVPAQTPLQLAQSTLSTAQQAYTTTWEVTYDVPVNGVAANGARNSYTQGLSVDQVRQNAISDGYEGVILMEIVDIYESYFNWKNAQQAVLDAGGDITDTTSWSTWTLGTETSTSGTPNITYGQWISTGNTVPPTNLITESPWIIQIAASTQPNTTRTRNITTTTPSYLNEQTRTVSTINYNIVSRTDTRTCSITVIGTPDTITPSCIGNDTRTVQISSTAQSPIQTTETGMNSILENVVSIVSDVETITNPSYSSLELLADQPVFTTQNLWSNPTNIHFSEISAINKSAANLSAMRPTTIYTTNGVSYGINIPDGYRYTTLDTANYLFSIGGSGSVYTKSGNSRIWDATRGLWGFIDGNRVYYNSNTINASGKPLTMFPSNVSSSLPSLGDSIYYTNQVSNKVNDYLSNYRTDAGSYTGNGTTITTYDDFSNDVIGTSSNKVSHGHSVLYSAQGIAPGANYDNWNVNLSGGTGVAGNNFNAQGYANSLNGIWSGGNGEGDLFDVTGNQVINLSIGFSGTRQNAIDVSDYINFTFDNDEVAVIAAGNESCTNSSTVSCNVIADSLSIKNPITASTISATLSVGETVELNNVPIIIVGAIDGANGDISSYSNKPGNTDLQNNWIVADGYLAGSKYYVGSNINNVAQGTSFAAPKVSAAIAVVADKFDTINLQEAASLILETAYDSFDGYDVSIHGHGKLDLAKALSPVGNLN